MTTFTLRHLMLAAVLPAGLLAPLHSQAQAQEQDVLRGEHRLGMSAYMLTDGMGIIPSPLYATGDYMEDAETGILWEEMALDYGAVTQIEATEEGGQRLWFSQDVLLQRGPSAYVRYGDLVLDTSQGIVYADLTMQAWMLNGTLEPYARLDAETGVTTLENVPFLRVGYASEDNRAFRMSMTYQGAMALQAGLRLSNPLTAALTSADLGELRLTTTPVPEASTFALMGLGLVGITLAAHRRRRTS